MSKFKQILPWLNIGILCLIGLALLIFAPIYTPIAICCFLLAFIFLCFQLLSMLRPHNMRVAKVLSCIFSILLCYGLIAVGFTAVLIWRSAVAVPQPGCEYIILLGCDVDGDKPSVSMQDRIQRAYAYMSANPNTICIASGGQFKNASISEASCMAMELIKMGISPERIWLEEQASSTQENLKYSLALIEEKTGFYPQSCGIVSSEYHLFRAEMIAKAQCVTGLPIPAQTSRLDLRINYFLREIAVSWYYLITGKM